MELRARRTNERGPGLEGAGQRAQRVALDVGGDAAALGHDEQACCHVEHADRDRRAESVEAAGRGMRYRERHRAEDANLGRSLDETSRADERARQALERDQLETVARLPRHRPQGLAATLCTLLAGCGPGLAVDQVDDAAHDRVADGGPIDEREHHAEERDALLGIEAAVHRVHQHQRVIGAELTVPRLLRQDGEALAPPGPIVSCARPGSVPARGSTVARTREPMRRKTSSQSADFRWLGGGGQAMPEPLENLGSTLRRRRRRRSTTIVMRYGCCIAHTRSMSCGIGMLYGLSTPSRTRLSARPSVSSVRS